MFNIGDKVKIKAPFKIAFDRTYEILGPSEATDTFKVDVWYDGVGSDFHQKFLELA